MLQKAKGIVDAIFHILISVYMVLIIVGMPFYFTEGYGRIGTNKYEFFHKVTAGMGAVALLPLFALFAVWCAKNVLGERRRAQKVFAEWKAKISVTGIFALLYLGVLLFSYMHSDYREVSAYGNAWDGAQGWYMGLETLLLLLGVTFVVSGWWKPCKWIPAMWLPVTFAVFLLGYCNRFGVYPLKMEYASPSFISTIGNINWYCGYIVTVFFGILYYQWADEKPSKWKKSVLISYGLMGFGALVTQGSSSGLLTLAVVGLVFFLLSAPYGKKMENFWMGAVMLGAACVITYGLRLVFPDRFNFPDPLIDLLTATPIGVLFLAGALGIFFVVRRWNARGVYPQKGFVRTGYVLAALSVCTIVLLVGLIACNTAIPGSIGRLSEFPLFTFNDSWGSHRGVIWKAGLRCWLDQDLSGKLLGVGPDCMASYIYEGGNAELLAMVNKAYPNKMLTNAHCEWLNILINEGLLGLAAYGGMMISAMVRYLKRGKHNPMVGACGICLLAYTVNNMISFRQSMATVTMFLILGIGEAFSKEEERWQ